MGTADAFGGDTIAMADASMHETAVDLKRSRGGAFVVEPLGWKIHGVIGPVERRRWWERPWALLCSSHGVIAVRRGFKGFWAAGVSAGFGGRATIVPDSLDSFTDARPGEGIVIPRKTIVAIAVRGRHLKHEIRLSLADGTESRFYVFARAAINDYRALLKRTYGPVYQETGFDAWWKLALW